MDFKSDIDLIHHGEEDHHDHDHDDQDHDQKKPIKMGRGKIQCKMIENQTNRQVTYSKRRNGIFKKASELSVLCDAKVSIIMIPRNATRVHEFCTPGSSTKEMLDRYQRAKGIDVWKTLYEKMQKNLREHREKNDERKREIRQRMGYDLSGLNWFELRDLEDSMSSAVEAIREKRKHKIKTQTDTTKKKVKSLEDRYFRLLHEIAAQREDSPYGPMYQENIGGGYESDNIGQWGIQSFRFPPPQPSPELSL
ncbi:MADS-box protein CMB2 isoform X2 [Morus notabilis]|uniref:MADS-box protein CMB2 isoform X2 n=1 Tax=Morus notabilis TaxID=981085 RepID=UPI000CED7B9A|nr:MADS-box protein CMB2 isoform X2 [Morus notabilis]